MNDFTKDELENIYRLLDYACEVHIENDATFELRDKVREMVDKYCEHEPHGDFHVCVDKCKKCGVICE
jgi:hypothetical protein